MLVLGLASCSSEKANPSENTTTTASKNEQTTADSSSEETSETTADNSESETADEISPDSSPETEADKKVLIVYFSASGNTAPVANDIANAAGADIFEIVPTEIYTDDDLNWSNFDSRVSREHDDESLRNVPLTTTIAGYDFIPR